MVCGTYVGNAPASPAAMSGNTQDISLGLTPQAVIAYQPVTGRSADTRLAIALPGKPVAVNPYGYTVLEIISGGFRAGSARHLEESFFPPMNSSGNVYFYIAFV